MLQILSRGCEPLIIPDEGKLSLTFHNAASFLAYSLNALTKHLTSCTIKVRTSNEEEVVALRLTQSNLVFFCFFLIYCLKLIQQNLHI